VIGTGSYCQRRTSAHEVCVILCDFYSDFVLFFSVLSNKLDAPMLNGIISALSQEIVPQGNNC